MLKTSLSFILKVVEFEVLKDLMYVGICLIYCNILTVVFTLFAIIMLHFQILQEEKFLEKAFENEYIDYKKKVFRYLGRK